MRIDDVITESINPDILNPDFQHRQEIDGFVYTAESKVYFNKLDTLKIRCYNHENEEIASVLFEVKQGKWLQAVQVVVEPEYRGEGLANTMYAYAKMLGNTIKPSGTQTDQGKAMWAKWGTDARHLTHEHNVAKSKPVTEDQDYMAGHCHVMAIALKMLHPAWQIRAHVGWEDDTAEDDEYRVDHVYIVAPDGSAYDCRGRFDSEEALVGEDVTGGFETQYADFDLADIEQLVQRGELKRFTREDINKAVAFAKRIQQ